MLKPLHDRVVVKRATGERTSPGGIHIPEGAGEKPEEGEVVAVGPGKTLATGVFLSTLVKVGDRVVFDRFHVHAVKLDGEELLVMHEENILGVLDSAPIP